MAMAQDAAASPSPSASPTGSPGTATAESVVVTSQELDISREQIVPSLGATRYTVGPDRLDSQAQGENAPFNQTILRFPGVAQDSFGQLHVRGEHANLQYRIDECSCPKAFPGSDRNCRPVLPKYFADHRLVACAIRLPHNRCDRHSHQKRHGLHRKRSFDPSR